MKPKYYHNCYMGFSPNNYECIINQRQWILGLIIILGFSPGLYFLLFDPKSINAPLWVGWLIFGFIYFAGLYTISYYQKSFFNKNTGKFKHEKGVLLPFKKIEGNLKDISKIELYTYTSTNTNDNGSKHKFVHSILLMHYKGKRTELIIERNANEARKLALLIGCPLEFIGYNKIWGISKRNHLESLDQIKRNLLS